MSKEQCKDKNNTENEKQKQGHTNENDIEASNDYDSDKKLQMKQISDKVNLAVRRCKKEVKKSQQLKLEIQIT